VTRARALPQKRQEPYPLPPAPLGVLVADPPWRFKDKLPGAGRGVEKVYKNTLSVKEISAFPLPPMEDDSVLLLWRVVGGRPGSGELSLAEQAFSVARAWGFDPVAEMVWNKREICAPCAGSGREKFPELELCQSCMGFGDRPAFLMGHRVRYAHEVVLICERGKPKRNDTKAARSVRSTFEARMPCHPGTFEPKHSAKPPELLELIETIWPGPYGELFARSQRPGWWAYGNELAPAKE
jgi:N6-adenosine-specific RNA methylase IME4